MNTRWHEEDVAGRVLEQIERKEVRGRVIAIPAIAEAGACSSDLNEPWNINRYRDRGTLSCTCLCKRPLPLPCCNRPLGGDSWGYRNERASAALHNVGRFCRCNTASRPV